MLLLLVELVLELCQVLLGDQRMRLLELKFVILFLELFDLKSQLGYVLLVFLDFFV